MNSWIIVVTLALEISIQLLNFDRRGERRTGNTMTDKHTRPTLLYASAGSAHRGITKRLQSMYMCITETKEFYLKRSLANVGMTDHESWVNIND